MGARCCLPRPHAVAVSAGSAAAPAAAASSAGRSGALMQASPPRPWRRPPSWRSPCRATTVTRTAWRASLTPRCVLASAALPVTTARLAMLHPSPRGVPPQCRRRRAPVFDARLLQAVNALEEALKASGASFELHRYPSVGHAFMNATPGGIARRCVGTWGAAVLTLPQVPAPIGW